MAPVPRKPWDNQFYTNGYRVAVGSDPWGTPELYVSGTLNAGFLGQEVSYADYKNLCEPNGGVSCNIFQYPYSYDGVDPDYSAQVATLQQPGAAPRLLAGSPPLKFGNGVAGCYHSTMFAPGTLKLYERWGAALWSFQPYGAFNGGVKPGANND